MRPEYTSFVLFGVLIGVIGTAIGMRPPTPRASPPCDPDPHWRAARVVNVVDGDTVDLLLLDSWGGIVEERREEGEPGIRVRLASVDTPELHAMKTVVGEEGLERVPDEVERARARHARQGTVSWIRRCKGLGGEWPFAAWSRERGSFGRPLTRLRCRATGEELSAYLVDAGLGERP